MLPAKRASAVGPSAALPPSQQAGAGGPAGGAASRVKGKGTGAQALQGRALRCCLVQLLAQHRSRPVGDESRLGWLSLGGC